MTKLKTRISNKDLSLLKKEHDAMVRTIFEYYKDIRGCDILTFAGFLCEDVLPNDLFQEVVIAKLKSRTENKSSEKAFVPIKAVQEQLDKEERAFYLRQNIDSCKSLAAMVSMVETKHVKSYGLKPRKNYNNLIKRS